VIPRLPFPPRTIPLADELLWGNSARDLAWAEANLDRLRQAATDAFNRVIRATGTRQQAVALWSKAEHREARMRTPESGRNVMEAESLYRAAVAHADAARAEFDRLNAHVRTSEASVMRMRQALPARLRGGIGKMLPVQAPMATRARFSPWIIPGNSWGT